MYDPTGQHPTTTVLVEVGVRGAIGDIKIFTTLGKSTNHLCTILDLGFNLSMVGWKFV